VIDGREAVGDVARARRARRIGSLGALVAGLVTLISTVTPPLRRRMNLVRDLIPVIVTQAASVVAIVAGIVLLQLARGLRRGQRTAWTVTVVLLGVLTFAHPLKALDVEEALVSLAPLVYLLVNRRHFDAPLNRTSVRRGVVTLGSTAVAAWAAAVFGLQVSRRHRMPFRRAVTAIPISGRYGRYITPTLLSVGVLVVAGTAFLLVRPVLAPRRTAQVGLDGARPFVERYGADTLAYFALRSDKDHYVAGETLISYAVHNGVCLVSPDPIGPPDQRESAWQEFQQYAVASGWSLAVLGAGKEWLPIYERSGMRHRYIGDEAVVDVTNFSLQGGTMKGLRQAVNRIANNGYTISFHDPAAMDATLSMALRSLMSESRKGDVERGFSMTLSRVFDRDDTGLLLAVCHGPDGAPVAFCQYVPAADIDGYSLDLMRRSTGEHPNGLTDFVVVKTIEHLRELGRHGLSLNFATLRAVLAGETGPGISQRVQRALLKRMGDSMQIESLWKYNAKFMPSWRPRYVVYDAPEHLVTIGIAIAKAESWFEFPVIGRLMRPA
jgi:lysylphosphatidylglycerol synthetase-like protein (DUF2156 family)